MYPILVVCIHLLVSTLFGAILSECLLDLDTIHSVIRFSTILFMTLFGLLGTPITFTVLSITLTVSTIGTHHTTLMAMDTTIITLSETIDMHILAPITEPGLAPHALTVQAE